MYPNGTILSDSSTSNLWLIRNTPWRPTDDTYYRVLVPNSYARNSVTQYGQNTTIVVDPSVLTSIPVVDKLTYSSLNWEDAQALLLEYAPFIWLSKNEVDFPVNVEWYFQRCLMAYNENQQNNTIFLDVGQVNDDNITDQIYISGSDGNTYYSHFPAGKMIPSNFYLNFPTAATNKPPATSPCTAPVYASVIDRTDAQGNQYRDLLYAFFYSYDQATAGSHQADWEHVVVRTDQASGNILAIYFQAHGKTDPNSIWYYPPDSVAGKPLPVFPGLSIPGAARFQYYGDSTKRFQVYSAIGSHASYTKAGTFSTAAGFGSDTTSQGTAWDATANLVVIDPALVNWVLYSGAWGSPLDDDHGTFGNPPNGPAAQGWLSTINPTSPVYHNSVALSANPKGYTNQSSRVSVDFTLFKAAAYGVTISGITPDQASGVTFNLVQDISHGNDKTIASGLGNGGVISTLANTNVDNLYIGDLKYVGPKGKVFTHTDVFTALNVTTFNINFDYQTSS